MIAIVDAIRILTSPDRLIHLLSPLFTSWLGYVLLFAIVFSETGLLVGFFLPGDSLMFLIGAVARAGNAKIFGGLCGVIAGANPRVHLLLTPRLATQPYIATPSA